MLIHNFYLLRHGFNIFLYKKSKFQLKLERRLDEQLNKSDYVKKTNQYN
jgi:hypothetical protein